MKHSLFFLLFCLLLAGSPTRRISAQQVSSQSVTKARSEQTIDCTKANGAIAKGKVESLMLDDKAYKRSRRIWVYTPSTYDQKASAPLRLLICFDGLAYGGDIPLPTILDNLIAANRIWPTIAVLVDNEESRLGDLANHQAFADFISKDLILWVRSHYRVTSDADKTTLCGYSAGGLAAAFVGWKHSELFGNVLSQSGAFWRGNEGGMDDLEWLTQQFKISPKLPLRFYLEVGALETLKTVGGPTLLDANRRLHQVLEAKGYEVHYLEVPGAQHEPGHWPAQLADGIIYFDRKPSGQAQASRQIERYTPKP